MSLLTGKNGLYIFWIMISNLQEATAKSAGPYLVPGNDFIGVAGMVEWAPMRIVKVRIWLLAGVESRIVQSAME